MSTPPVPERIGKYTISAVLGRGSMGTVYKGFDPHIQRPVAIKTVHRELLGDTQAADSIAARFRNEAKAVGRIQHPGVVAIYDFGEDGDVTFIAMEFVDGRTLDEILAVPQMLSEANVLAVMDQLLESLSVAHAQGVWHRDIKPANLIVTKQGQVKLTDFGIARLEDANLTQTSSMIGTPAYMAPEQFTGKGIDHRADLFACGVLLYRMLTGRRAFTGATQEVMYKILNEEPPAPSVVTKGLRPAAFDAVVARAIAKNPADRYPDALAMRAALQALSRAPAAPGAKATVILPIPREGEPSGSPRAVSPSVARPGARLGHQRQQRQRHRRRHRQLGSGRAAAPGARARHPRGPDGPRDGARGRAHARRPRQPGHRRRAPHPRGGPTPAVHRAGARRQPRHAGGLAHGQRRDADPPPRARGSGVRPAERGLQDPCRAGRHPQDGPDRPGDGQARGRRRGRQPRPLRPPAARGPARGRPPGDAGRDRQARLTGGAGPRRAP